MDEIATWLASNGSGGDNGSGDGCGELTTDRQTDRLTTWVALDDMELAKHAAISLAAHFVETECDVGLTEERAAEVRRRVASLARRERGIEGARIS